MTKPRLSEELTEAVVVALLGAAEGSESRAIMRAAVRAGLMWRCTCQQVNYLTHERCVECGEPPRRAGR